MPRLSGRGAGVRGRVIVYLIASSTTTVAARITLTCDAGQAVAYVAPMIRSLIPRLSVLLSIAGAAPTAVALPTEPPPPAPTEPTLQGAYGDWSLYEFQQDGGPVCYLASRILKSSESVPGRRPSFMLITNRPGEGRWGVVSVVAGYAYQEGSTVTVAIGRRQFHLFTDRDTAWAEDSDDPLIVAALRGGSTLNVNGHMKDGPVVSDNFSLKGAAQALAVLDQTCPMPGRPVPKAHGKKRKKAS